MEQIKPCPFCGSDKCRVEQNVFDDLKYCVHCPSCGAESSDYEHPGSAVKAWNMRTVTHLLEMEREMCREEFHADNDRLRGILAEALAVIEYNCLHCNRLNPAECSPCCMAYAVKVKLRTEVEK